MQAQPTAAEPPAGSAGDARLFWILRTGAALCFIGHGAFGVITKKAWLPYFAVGGVPESVAWHLMPWIGAMDITLGLLALVWPCRALFAWASVWTIWTALCRPLAGQGWPEFFERAGNYGVPIAILAVVGLGAPWFARLPDAWPSLAENVERRLAWVLRLTTATLIAGHGACGAILQKTSLAQHYALFAPEHADVLVTWIGVFEFGLACAVLALPFPRLLIAACVWKLACESLFLFSGAPTPFFEVMERGGSYIAPLALAFLLSRRSTERTFAASSLSPT
jgi:hypothetical protein